MAPSGGATPGFCFVSQFQRTIEKGNRLTLCPPKFRENSTCQAKIQTPHHVWVCQQSETGRDVSARFTFQVFLAELTAAAAVATGPFAGQPAVDDGAGAAD